MTLTRALKSKFESGESIALVINSGSIPSDRFIKISKVIKEMPVFSKSIVYMEGDDMIKIDTDGKSFNRDQLSALTSVTKVNKLGLDLIK